MDEMRGWRGHQASYSACPFGLLCPKATAIFFLNSKPADIFLPKILKKNVVKKTQVLKEKKPNFKIQIKSCIKVVR
jgi:hypothetical protein